MKKWLIALPVLIILSLVYYIYIFIPSRIIISKTESVQVTRNVTTRIFGEKIMWERLFTQNISDNSSIKFSYNNKIYKIKTSIFSGAQVTIKNGNDSSINNVFFISTGADSTLINWQSNFQNAGINPIKRIHLYQQAVSRQKDISEILKKVKTYLEKPENIYGLKINRESTIDTFLIAAKNQYNYYPGTKDIYTLINTIKIYISANGGLVTDKPIINITPIENNKYQLMAAVPINKELSGNFKFLFKRMIPGNFITTIVKGDTSKINEANKQILFFFDDYEKTPMAIPFQSLITDRSFEKDSTKWITKCYFPVMQ